MTPQYPIHSSRRSELAPFVDRRHAVACRHCGELFAVAGEECLAADHERAHFQFRQLCEHSVEVALATGIQDMDLQPEGKSRRQYLTRCDLG